MNNNKNWEANCCQENEDKYEKWVAEGQPREKYDEIFKKKDGKEYKINLDKLPGVRWRMMVGLRDAREEVHFPGDASLKNCDRWLELVLPSSYKETQ